MRIDLESLTPNRLDQLNGILDEVLDLEPAEATAALDRLCAGDAELRAQAEALLGADRGSRNFLTRPAMEWVPGLLEEAREADRTGSRLGPWRIVRELGRGGMGRVYLAERADGAFEQKVAVKVLKRGLDTDEILARFIQERQILARLDDPHIARVVDGGVTEDGLPWFALEYIEGAPLTEYSRSRNLGVPERLRLFLQACRAVQFAHRNLIVHRDLKPSNILVSESGEVKLLDFGIAKILEADEEGSTTLGPIRLMTPTYAAPEQIRGEPPTTATDVFALGVVLHELLTGERPTREEGAVRLLRGDLGNIVLQAIRKEPEERYASAEALAEDLERYLEGRPVRASGQRFSYLARKFVKRNRAAVSGAVLLLLSLAGGLAGTAWQARRATAERDRALLEAKKATEIKEFTLRLFSVSDPAESRGASITARDLLERGTQRVNRELQGQPAVRAEMLAVLGSVYYGLGDYARAETLTAAAVHVARTTKGFDPEDLATTLYWRGIVRRAQGNFLDAKADLFQVMAIRRARNGERSRPFSEVLNELGGTYQAAGAADSAEICYRRMLAIDRTLYPPDDPAIAADLDQLSVALFDKERNQEAYVLQRESIRIRERKLGHMHPETANAISNAAFTLRELGRFAEAESMFQDAIRIRTRVLGPEHIDIAVSYANLAELKRDLGEYPEASVLYERALAIERKNLNPDHPDINRDMNNAAILYYQQGRYPLALERFREALASRRRTLPPDDRGSITMEHNIACVLRNMGRYREAEKIFRDTRARRARTLGENHLDISGSDHHLGILMHLMGRDDEAERRIRNALAMRDSLAGSEHPLTAQSAEALASLLRDRDHYRESLPLYQRAVAINAKVFAHPSPQSAEAWTGLGRLLLVMGRPAEARAYLQQAIPVRQRAYGPEDPRTAETMVALGICLAEENAPAEAETLLTKALPVLRRRPGRPDRLLDDGGKALASLREISSTH